MFFHSGTPAGIAANPSSPPDAEGRTLFAQSAARILQREFSGNAISFLLFDVRSGILLASHWDDPETPIPMGSLVKPFTALAYAEEHEFRFPSHICRGKASGCWLPRGHGRMNIRSALAHSCNSYFRILTANMNGGQIAPVARRFGFDAPSPELSGSALIGLGDRWRIAPMRMAEAYLALRRGQGEPGIREILDGMEQSARIGTGAAVGRALGHSSALVKTGTAACTHRKHAPGDGFVVALAPATEPELLLLVRVHGVPGSQAAATAGKMLSRIKE